MASGKRISKSHAKKVRLLSTYRDTNGIRDFKGIEDKAVPTFKPIRNRDGNFHCKDNVNLGGNAKCTKSFTDKNGLQTHIKNKDHNIPQKESISVRDVNKER